MPLDNKLNIVNKTNESIQVLITESPGWKLVGRVETAVEALTAAQALMAALIAAPELGIGALALEANSWSAAKLFSTFNSARRVYKIAKNRDKYANLLQSAMAVIDGIPKVSRVLGTGQSANLLDQSGWGELFSAVGWGDLVGAQTIIITLYSNTTGKALHFYSAVNETWTITNDGAQNTNNAHFTWDGYASSAWHPTTTVDADNNVIAFWVDKNMTLGSQYLNPLDNLDQPDLDNFYFGPLALGIGATFYKNQLYLAYGESEGSNRYFGLYKAGTMKAGWGSESGYLLYDPYRVPTWGDDIGGTGVSLASYKPSDGQPQMVACFHQTDGDTPYTSSLTIMPYAPDNGNSPRRFGDQSPPTVYRPDGAEMHSYSTPSIVYQPDGTLVIAVDVGQQSTHTNVEVYSIGQYTKASALLGTVQNTGRPGLGLFKGNLYVAVSLLPPNEGIAITSVAVNVLPMVLVSSDTTNGSIAFSSVNIADVETAYLTWHSTDGGIYYAFSYDLNTWHGPYPVNDFINPQSPDGGD